MLKNFYTKKSGEVLEILKTSENGLSDSEARRRQEKYGKNILPEKKKDGVVKIFMRELAEPLVLLLIMAIIASVIVGEVMDAIVIAFIILADAVMGTFQENKANKTASSLSKLVQVQVNVLRGGIERLVGAEDLVPGDIIYLESGDKVPADLRLLEVHNLTIDEAILTGESVQVVKISEPMKGEKSALADRLNVAYSGTTVVSGRATAVVITTGLETELGQIADSMNTAENTKSPLTIRIAKLSRQITVMIVVVAILTTILLVSKRVEPAEILITVIAFAVSAMPEGLPLALTMALTIASNRMAKRNVIVRKLKAAESLGSCTVIASDKTGTLTVNQQTVKKILLPNGLEYEISGTGYDFDGKVTGEKLDLAREIGFLGAINNEASIEKEPIGDSIDIAFLVLAEKLKVKTADIEIIERIPYESENKYSAVFYKKENSLRCTVKGSPEVVLAFCKNANLVADKNSKELLAQNEKLASEGFRVIALADGEVDPKKTLGAKDIKNLTFMGMIAFMDPVRKQAKKSIADCKKAGIKVIMVTGDHPLTALSIAKDLQLATDRSQVATGEEVDEAYGDGERDFDNFVKEKTVFARVAPLQKLRIVESLKRQGEFVAVTGDGVNDAPALKSANIGVAMGSGTDIARETADMIIVDDNFQSIVAGVEEGRIAYANIRKIMYFLLSCGLSEAVFFALSIMLNFPMPLTAVQFLWLNIVTDGLQDFALSFEKGEKNVLREPPRSPKESIFDKSLLIRILTNGAILTAMIFSVWAFLLRFMNFDIEVARGYTLCAIVFIQNLHVLNCRSERQPFYAISILKNPIVIITIVGNILLQILIMESATLSGFLGAVSISVVHVLLIFAFSLLVIPLVEVVKRISNKFIKD